MEISHVGVHAEHCDNVSDCYDEKQELRDVRDACAAKQLFMFCMWPTSVW